MRSLLPTALLTALALAILPSLPPAAHAGAGVLRCHMPDGSNVYTDKACSALGATAAALPGEVLTRIEREVWREATLSGIDPRDRAMNRERGYRIAAITPVGRLIRGCAGSPQQLAINLQAAVVLGDVNRLAETYHWNGMRNAEAQRIMSRLEQLSSRQVASVEYFDATIGSLGSDFADAGGSTPVDGDAGMVQAVINVGHGTQVVDFSVRRDEGCYFVRY